MSPAEPLLQLSEKLFFASYCLVEKSFYCLIFLNKRKRGHIILFFLPRPTPEFIKTTMFINFALFSSLNDFLSPLIKAPPIYCILIKIQSLKYEDLTHNLYSLHKSNCFEISTNVKVGKLYAVK